MANDADPRHLQLFRKLKVPYIPMRISTRISLALVASGVIIFGIFGTLYYRGEQRDLHSVARKYTELLGRSLQVAVENAVRDHQMTDVTEIFDRLEHIDPEMDVFVLDPHGRVRKASQSQIVLDTISRESVYRVLQSGAADIHLDTLSVPMRLVFASALHDDAGKLIGAVALIRPLKDVEADLASTRLSLGGTILLFVLGTWIMGFVLGHQMITLPLFRLAAAMRRMRAGEKSEPLTVLRRDEIGALLLEFNALTADLKRAQAELKESLEARRTLEQQLRDVDKMVTVGQLSAELAHEIGSPLQVLNGRARALQKRPDQTEHVARCAGIMVEQTERIARIVQQLLRVSRRRAPSFDRIDIMETIRDVVELLDLDARRQQVTLTVARDGDVPTVEADGDQVQQVVLNLLRNALMATGPGGVVTLTVTAYMAVLPGEQESVPAVLLAVADTGSGMSTETLTRAFEPFFSNWASKEGTGLGLAVVRRIVEDHCGTFRAESEPGEGSRFSIILPVRHTREPRPLHAKAEQPTLD